MSVKKSANKLEVFKSLNLYIAIVILIIIAVLVRPLMARETHIWIDAIVIGLILLLVVSIVLYVRSTNRLVLEIATNTRNSIRRLKHVESISKNSARIENSEWKNIQGIQDGITKIGQTTQSLHASLQELTDQVAYENRNTHVQTRPNSNSVTKTLDLQRAAVNTVRTEKWARNYPWAQEWGILPPNLSMWIPDDKSYGERNARRLTDIQYRVKAGKVLSAALLKTLGPEWREDSSQSPPDVIFVSDSYFHQIDESVGQPPNQGLPDTLAPRIVDLLTETRQLYPKSSIVFWDESAMFSAEDIMQFASMVDACVSTFDVSSELPKGALSVSHEARRNALLPYLENRSRVLKIAERQIEESANISGNITEAVSKDDPAYNFVGIIARALTKSGVSIAHPDTFDVLIVLSDASEYAPIWDCISSLRLVTRRVVIYVTKEVQKHLVQYIQQEFSTRNIVVISEWVLDEYPVDTHGIFISPYVAIINPKTRLCFKKMRTIIGHSHFSSFPVALTLDVYLSSMYQKPIQLDNILISAAQAINWVTGKIQESPLAWFELSGVIDE